MNSEQVPFIFLPSATELKPFHAYWAEPRFWALRSGWRAFSSCFAFPFDQKGLGPVWVCGTGVGQRLLAIKEKKQRGNLKEKEREKIKSKKVGRSQLPRAPIQSSFNFYDITPVTTFFPLFRGKSVGCGRRCAARKRLENVHQRH